MEIHAQNLIRVIREEVAEYDRKYKDADVSYLYLKGEEDYWIIPYWVTNQLRNMERYECPYKFIGEVLTLGIEQYKKKYDK